MNLDISFTLLGQYQALPVFDPGQSFIDSELSMFPPSNLKAELSSSSIKGRKLRLQDESQEEQLEKVRQIISSAPVLPSASDEDCRAQNEPLFKIIPVVIEGKTMFQLQRKSLGIRGLNFSGGGSMGIAYAGAICALHDGGVLKKVERVSGSSAGAMTALMVSIGLSPEAFANLVKEVDVRAFISFFNRASDTGTLTIRSTGEGMIKLFEEIERCQIKNYLDLEKGFLLSEEEYQAEHCHEEEAYRGQYQEIKSRLEQFVKGEEGVEFTFSDAVKLRSVMKKENRHLIKDLYIGVTQERLGFEEYSFEKTPNFSRAKAAQISGAHPAVFVSAVDHMGYELADGGIVNNSPTELLENKSTSGFQGTASNLNFVFAEHEEREKDEVAQSLDSNHQSPRKFKEISLDNFSEVPNVLNKIKDKLIFKFLARFLCNQNLAKNNQKVLNKMRKRSYAVVRLDTLSYGITTLSGLLPFSSPPSQEAKKRSIEKAYEDVKEHLENRGLYREEEEWCYENFDTLEEARAQL